ncbi:hypothetical protein Misp01_12860 [Microtetraspora sp. NBRC 13810]|uniref:DUF695 domain-containing protein n=1 Tax=Microtetraspora sp. NBRC 13810 TaxID=3030990 RepID=UPI0024A32783|nr:DUF695 domain-containing protein [Microtetraspora sp. NBRC 13810]GLW06156.1 hypothetical protein Misp01_12860 [Microtetraspora sp. NBRC 13810]
MRQFGRKTEKHDPARRIAEFWAWWSSARPEIDTLVAAGDAERLTELVAPAVAAVHPGLVWEVAPGRTAAQALVVTAAGDPALRSLAHRLAGAAPAADAQWEYHPSRQANPQALDVTLDVGGYDFDLGQLMLGLRVPRDRPQVDMVVYHPIYTLLDEETRLQATVLALHWLIGEDDVARWAGEITTSAFPPIDAVAAVHLPAVVADLAAGYDQEQWALLEGRTGDGARLIAVARHPLRHVDHPLFDRHIEITLPYAHADADGLPAEESARALREFEERLVDRLTELKDTALLVAHLSAEGRRVMHVYADPAGDAPARLQELAADWPEGGGAQVVVADDPGWSAVAPFLS